MDLLKRIVCCLVVIAAAPVLLSGGAARTAGSSLQLSVQPGKPEYQKGEPLRIGFVLQNNGTSPLVLFHPDTINESWMGWEISCTVTRPDGRKVRLEPEILSAMGRMPQKANFHEIPVGGALTTAMTITESSNSEPGDRWVAYLKIPNARSSWPEKGLRRKYDIRGDYGFMTNGAETWLTLKDTGMDVFNQPGRYLLECRYVNPHEQIFDENMKLLPLSAWAGTLTATASLVIMP